MSTPADQLVPDASAAADVASSLGMPGEDMSWITDFHIDDTIVPIGAPLPEAGQAGTEEKPASAAAEASTKTAADAVVPAEAKPDAAAAPDAGLEAKPDAAAVTEADKKAADAGLETETLSPLEESIIKALPEAEQPAARSRMKGHTFMDFYLQGEKSKEEVRQHLQERSPSNYADFETAVVANYFAKPEESLAGLYQRDPATFQKVATAVYNGDQKYFTKLVTGRDAVDPETIKTALDFYDRNKDVISEDEPLSALDEETLTEMEKFFPEKVPVLRAQLEAAQKLKGENDSLKAAAKPHDEAVDPKVVEAEQQAQSARVENEIWDVARDTVGDFIEAKALSSAGIAVTPEERTSAPMVARLKDFKAQVLFFGLHQDGKQIIPSFQQGINEWGEGRQPYMEKILHVRRFAEAHEKDNALDVAKSLYPFAEIYYQDRLKLPIFKEIDDLIALVTSQGSAKPKMDPIVPGSLPAGSGAKNGVEASGDWLVSDAVARSSK